MVANNFDPAFVSDPTNDSYTKTIIGGLIMRKAISLFLACMLFWGISTISYADFDLSGMSFDELVALKEQINLAIWNSKEWQEVEVPQGIWEVGKDIPAGKWTVKACPESSTDIFVGTALKDNGNKVDYYINKFLQDEGNKSFNAMSNSSWTFDLNPGDYVEIGWGTAIFMPYTGKPSLGFKNGSETVESESNVALNDNTDDIKPETETPKPKLDDLNDGKLIDMGDVVAPSIQPEIEQETSGYPKWTGNGKVCIFDDDYVTIDFNGFYKWTSEWYIPNLIITNKSDKSINFVYDDVFLNGCNVGAANTSLGYEIIPNGKLSFASANRCSITMSEFVELYGETTIDLFQISFRIREHGEYDTIDDGLCGVVCNIDINELMNS